MPLFQNESSCKRECDLHNTEHVGGTHFHMNSFALRLVLHRGKRQLGNSLLAQADGQMAPGTALLEKNLPESVFLEESAHQQGLLHSGQFVTPRGIPKMVFQS